MTLGRPRLHLRETTSTNDRARVLAAAGAPHGTLVTAAAQTAGRGRQGRSWAGPPGRALLCSLLLREYDPLLPLRAGLAVADLAGDEGLVKWPKDVLVGGRKLAGVLAEASEGRVVLGVGINVNQTEAELPSAPRMPATSLRVELGHELDRAELLVAVLAELERAYDEWVADLPTAAAP